MTAFLFTLIALALTVYGLQRNHARNGHPQVAGSVDIDDRDIARMLSGLRSPPPRTRTGLHRRPERTHSRSVAGAC